jgi:CO/xanthine dehydrogenase FAD-binding subunit
MGSYLRPASVGEALLLLSQQRCRPLAGGTDFYPALSHAAAWGQPGLAHPLHPATLDLSAIDELRGIRDLGATLEIGALATWTEALQSTWPAFFDAVRLAAREIGGWQIQNRATLVGNLCNASPAADGAPPLLALDAQVRLQSVSGKRELPLAQFILGNRRTARWPEELVTALIIPKPAAATRSTFLKLGARQYLVISIAMVALVLSVDTQGAISAARIAVGACSAMAQRLPALEQRLLGQPLGQAASQVRAEDFAALAPIDDVRASAAYRRHAAQVLVRRGLAQLADG